VQAIEKETKFQDCNEITEKLKSASNSRSFCVIFGQDKREICAYSIEDLIKNIHDKFEIENDHQFLRMEYWSLVYQDWILLDGQLPEINSKIKICLKEM
jgi:hypothetical protein